MNRYQATLNRWAPPGGFEDRLRAKVLLEAPQESPRNPYRPRSYARKILLTALLALALTASVAAAVIAIPWDQIFLNRFGGDEATLSLGETAFQEVNVTSVCGDTTLTIRQALGDTNTIYFILDITLPENVPLARAWAESEDSDGAFVSLPSFDFYATGDMSWEAIREKSYKTAQTALKRYRFPGGATIQTETKDYDPATNTLTLLVSFTTDSAGKKLTDQPLTILVGGMTFNKDGVESSLFEGPLLITFEPAYTAQAQVLELTNADGAVRGKVILSPFAIEVEAAYPGYPSIEAFYRDIRLVYRDGSIVRPEHQGYGGGGSKPKNSDFLSTVSVGFRFKNILDLSEVAAVRIGELEAVLDD